MIAFHKVGDTLCVVICDSLLLHIIHLQNIKKEQVLQHIKKIYQKKRSTIKVILYTAYCQPFIHLLKK
jgi:hypothetical protein